MTTRQRSWSISNNGESSSHASTSEPKRARIVENLEDSENEDFDILTSLDATQGEISSDEDEQANAPLPVREDGYVDGSIVKITLKNFVTYDYCEVFPGPQLNMIIGPNGTGKSTIVCAIALGLGGAPSLLGRAKNVTEFIKTGADESTIQIELKNGNGKNITIQRTIHKANNQNSWKINFKSASQKEVISTIAKFDIQVDNLCQFLPQDKVAEFAQLSPPLLLKRTQLAAGEKKLSEWQSQLIEWRTAQRDLTLTYESGKNHLKVLLDRNVGLEKDVYKLKQREAALKKVAVLKATLPLAQYSSAKARHDEAKAEEQEKKAFVQEIEASHTPINEALLEIETEYKNATSSLTQFKQAVTEMSSKLTEETHKLDRSRILSSEAKKEIENLEKREVAHQVEIKKLETRIEYAKNKLGPEPVIENTDDIKKAINEIETTLGQYADKHIDLRRRYDDINRQRRTNMESIEENKRELGEIQNVQKRRMVNLKRSHQDTFTAAQWLKANKSMFHGKVYGPIQMCINVKDQKYASIVEAALGGENGSHLKTFVCENQEDYKTFTRETVDKQKLRLTVSWPGENGDQQFQTPMSEEQLRTKYEMEHFVSDLLEGPPTVIKYLCQQTKIHLIPVSLYQEDQQRIANCGQFKKFIIKNSFYNVKQYSYGRGGKQTAIRQFKPASVLADSINTEARTRLMQDLHMLEMEAKKIDQDIKELTNEKDQLAQKERELKHEKENLQVQRKDVYHKLNKWRQGKTELEYMEDDLQRKLNRPSTLSEDIAVLEQRILDQAIIRSRLAETYKNILKDYISAAMKRNAASIKALQLSAKLDDIKRFAKSQMLDLERAKIEHSKAVMNTNIMKRDAQRFYREAERAGNELEGELAIEFRVILEKWKTTGLEQSEIEIEDAINAETAKADAIKATNPRAMENYEDRLADITKLTAKVASDKDVLDELAQKIERVKHKWQPRLEKLVFRISKNFSSALQRIGCAGEVGISEHEDFDKWGIEIRVKFRDNEKLQILTGQRQSGGERAVSTILYLMSLQDLARAPFRVVDEINQGMDPRNERMIHEQIVQGASRPGTAQYFLITPKLLPDLYYNERMRVLCIYNGEWQPARLKPAREYLLKARTAATTY
ncbi:hypothetical protein CLU79DRAFT_763165 [Phycomyces nitens]|nr:hypothetical protein CLU79DRAFT_763165 [Phycomyces nitens]